MLASCIKLVLRMGQAADASTTGSGHVGLVEERPCAYIHKYMAYHSTHIAMRHNRGTTM